jgi:hypothetical protein
MRRQNIEEVSSEKADKMGELASKEPFIPRLCQNKQEKFSYS